MEISPDEGKEADVKSLQERLTRQERGIDLLLDLLDLDPRTDVPAIRAGHERLTRELSAAQAENSALKQRAIELEGTVEARDRQLDGLRAELASIRASKAWPLVRLSGTARQLLDQLRGGK